MARVLIVFATTEGHTRRVAEAVAREVIKKGNQAEVIELSLHSGPADVEAYDAVIIAASVHAGKHQRAARGFVLSHRDFLKTRITAFLSVSLFAASTDPAGLDTAEAQAQSFLRETGWRPDYVETVPGAFRYSGFSRPWQWVIKTSERLFKKELQKQGWPRLTEDQEFTRWEAVRGFVDRLCAQIESSGAESCGVTDPRR